MASGTTDLTTYDTIINVVVRLRPSPDVPRLKREFEAEILNHLRFRAVPYQRVPLAEIEWLVQRVNLDHHFVQHVVPSEAAAKSVIEHVANTVLRDKTKPWWEVHVIKIDGDDKNGFIIIRVHHAVADGISLTEAFAPLMRTCDGSALDIAQMFNPRHLTAKKPKRNPLTRAVMAVAFGASFVVEAFRVIGGAILPGDKPNRFCHSQWPYSGPRITVYFPSHKLSLIKAIKDKAGRGTTVNDVEFAVFAGALRRFLQNHDPKSDVSRLQLRALTPLALLEEADPDSKYSTMLRNLFTFVVNTLPTKQRTAKERLDASRQSWSHLKSSANVPAAFAIHKFTAKLPLAVQRKTVIDLMSRHSVVFSNVPGPQTACFLAGSQLMSVHMVYPNFTPQVGIISLNGEVHTCLTIQPDKEIDLRKVLPSYFQEELETLAKELGVPLDA